MRGIILAAGLAFAATAAQAEPTDVTVHVISKDAKFVGTSMGGVQIVLREAGSGAVLAEGVTEGGTGDTARIMESSGRSPQRADESAAAFRATLDVEEPMLVELEAYGPLDHPESAIRVSQQRWIMPGEDVTIGDGWLVELPGLVITPQVHMEGLVAHISAKVEPMCGCPITPGGLWPAEEYEVTATLWQEGAQFAESELAFDTPPGVFSGEIALPESGRYRLVLHAYNTRTGNSGIREWRVAAD